MAISSKGAVFPAFKFSKTLFLRSLPTFLCLPKLQAQGHAKFIKGIWFSWSLQMGLWDHLLEVLERPSLDQSQFDNLPEASEGGNIGRLSDRKVLGRGDCYKVLLIDDARHSEKIVEKALPPVVPCITVTDARKIYHESREKGVAVVIITIKEHAEFYALLMIRHGLRSCIEPDSDMG